MAIVGVTLRWTTLKGRLLLADHSVTLSSGWHRTFLLAVCVTTICDMQHSMSGAPYEMHGVLEAKGGVMRPTNYWSADGFLGAVMIPSLANLLSDPSCILLHHSSCLPHGPCNLHTSIREDWINPALGS
jgi:hypothetical protein